MSENRVDLGNVKGDRGLTGVGIQNVVLVDYDEYTCEKTYRMYYTDSTQEHPHYEEYVLTDNEAIRRVNDFGSISVISSADYKNIPTIALLKEELIRRPLSTDVYRQEQLYTKTEVESKILEFLANIDLFEVVSTLPTGNNIKDNRLYLLTKNTDNTDSLNQNFDLYIYADNDWKKLDNLTFNINNYYTKDTIDGFIDAKQDKNKLSNNISSDSSSTTKYPSVKSIKDYVDNKANTDFANYYTKAEIDAMIGDIRDFIHS